jgi:hypothetical protein
MAGRHLISGPVGLEAAIIAEFRAQISLERVRRDARARAI